MNAKSAATHGVQLALSIAIGVICQPAVAQDDGASGLEEVIVTARKRDESIMEIPLSISAMSQNQLERAGVDNAEELSSFVAGLQFEGSTATGGRYNPAIRFRGMNQQIITPSTQVGALFWDGSYIAGGGAFLPLADVERVEVIKGPQTAYFGRNTFSGAVNIIPKMPTDEWEADLAFEYSPSQDAEYKAEIGFGGPLTDDIGLRVFAGYEEDGGDFKTLDGTPYARFEDTTVAGTLTWDPTDKLSLKLSGYYVKADDNGTSMGVDSRVVGVGPGQCNLVYTGEYLNAVTGERTPFTRNLADYPGASFCGRYPDGSALVAPVTVNPTAAQAILGRNLDAIKQNHPLLEKYDILRNPAANGMGGRNQTWRAQLGGDYEWGEHTISFQMSHANTGTSDRRDFWFGVTPTQVPDSVLLVGSDIAIRERYYEARIASPSDQRLRYMVGFSDYDQGYRQGNAPTNLGSFPNGAGATIDFQDNRTTAFFGSIDYDINDMFTLSAEVRFTDEETFQIKQGNPGLPCSDPALVCGAKDDYTDFIPRVILSYQPDSDNTYYASYSYSSLLGVASQAAFVNSVAPEVIPDDLLAVLGAYTAPQENVQYEIGWKRSGQNYSFSAALFWIDWENQPFAAVIVLPAGGTTSYRGAGDSEYKGFDFEYTWSPTDWFDLMGTVAYTDSEMTSFSSRGSNESAVLGSGALSVVNDGNEARNTPPLTFSLSPTFHGNWGDRPWFFRVDVLYRDEAWADYSEYNRIGDQTLVNLRWGIDINEQYGVELYGKNIFDDKTLGLNGGTTSNLFFGAERKVFNEPYQRPEYGIRFTASF